MSAEPFDLVMGIHPYVMGEVGLPALYRCNACGSVVIDKHLHFEWHAKVGH